MMMQYTANGAPVTKSLERATWASNQLGGSYYGGLVGTAYNCNPSYLNGYATLLASMTIVQSGSQLNIAGLFQDNSGASSTCSFSLTYAQFGRLGSASGAYGCASGVTGTLTLSQLEATANGFLATATGTTNTCAFQGRFAAVKSN